MKPLILSIVHLCIFVKLDLGVIIDEIEARYIRRFINIQIVNTIH